MNRISFRTALLTASAMFTVSCAGGAFNGPEDALTVAETHPISVDSQVVTLTIDVDGAVSDISDIDRARLRAFANSYLLNGHGPLTITAPSGTSADLDGREATSGVRQALNDAGVSWASLSGATYRVSDNGDGDQLIVSYTHYVATASRCGDWSGIRSRDYKNLRSPNYGCATQNNLAAMIADPRDLVAPAASTPRDGVVAVRAIDLYRNGEDTASATGDIDTEASN